MNLKKGFARARRIFFVTPGSAFFIAAYLFFETYTFTHPGVGDEYFLKRLLLSLLIALPMSFLALAWNLNRDPEAPRRSMLEYGIVLTAVITYICYLIVIIFH